MIENYYEYKAPKDLKPKQIVILLHGVGSNGEDLISLAPYFARLLPEAVFISPDAPYAFDQAPPGFGGFQWFPLYTKTYEGRLEGLKAVTPLVHDFIDKQLERYNLPAGKLALVGFSQGTMTSLYVGPRYKDKIAGVLGYSGALIWEDEAPKDLKTVPVHLIHGAADEVVPASSYNEARTRLEKSGFTVTGEIEEGLQHSISNEGIHNGARFLESIFA